MGRNILKNLLFSSIVAILYSTSYVCANTSAILHESYRTGSPISNIEIDGQIFNASTSMAKQLNLPIYDDNNTNYSPPQHFIDETPQATKKETPNGVSFSQMTSNIENNQNSEESSPRDLEFVSLDIEKI